MTARDGHTPAGTAGLLGCHPDVQRGGDCRRNAPAARGRDGELGAPWEAIYINDGSRDASLQIVEMLRHADSHIAVVNLSRNFGKEIATTAGLDHARGDAVIVIDADLQDPPEVIPASSPPGAPASTQSTPSDACAMATAGSRRRPPRHSTA